MKKEEALEVLNHLCSDEAFLEADITDGNTLVLTKESEDEEDDSTKSIQIEFKDEEQLGNIVNLASFVGEYLYNRGHKDEMGYAALKMAENKRR